MKLTETVEITRPPDGHRRPGPGARRRPGVRRRLHDRPVRRRPRRTTTSRTRGSPSAPDDDDDAAADPHAAADPRGQPGRRRARPMLQPAPTGTASSRTTSTRRPTWRPRCASAATGCPSSSPRWTAGWSSPASRVRTVPVSDVRAGDQVVCGAAGVRVVLPRGRVDRSDGRGLRVHELRGVQREAAGAAGPPDRRARCARSRRTGDKVLWVGGPAVVHTGAAPAMVALVEAGYVDVLFAGNALATHDIEAALYGTSLGVDLDRRAAASSTGTSTTSGRSTRSAGPARSPPRSSRAC